MAYTIKCSLSKSGIKNLRRSIKTLSKELNNSKKDINDRIAEQCSEKMLEYHDEFISSLPEDKQVHSAMIRVISKRNSSRAIIFGQSVLYDEFGTGDVGANKPHPDKSKFDLNDYSSGPYVSTHVDDIGHYWKYNNITQRGVPAGKFFYNTLMDMEKGEAKKIAKEVVHETLDKTLGGDK